MSGTGVTLSDLTNGMLTITRGQSSISFIVSGDQDNDAEDNSVTLALTTDDDKVISRQSVHRHRHHCGH